MAYTNLVLDFKSKVSLAMLSMKICGLLSLFAYNKTKNSPSKGGQAIFGEGLKFKIENKKQNNSN